MKKMLLVALFVRLLFPATPSGAEAIAERPGEPRAPVAALSAEAVMVVSRDLMDLSFLIEEAGTDRVETSRKVSERYAALQEILAAFRKEGAITLDSTDRSAYMEGPAQPDSASGKKAERMWRDQLTVHVSGRDFALLSRLSAQAESVAATANVSFRVSEELLREKEGDLIQQAAAAFREKAKVIVESLGYKSYRILEVSVGDGGRPIPTANYRSNVYAMKDTAASFGADYEDGSGQARLRLLMSGVVEMVEK